MKHKTARKQPLLFHNSRCSKSRACLKILQEKKIPFEEVHYLKEGLSISLLNKITINLVNPLSNLVRTNEKLFKLNAFDVENKKLVIAFLNKNPICMQRPLYYDGINYIICRPPETVINYL